MHRALLICNSYYPLDPARLPELLGPRTDGLLIWAALTHRDEGLFHPTTVQLLNERRNGEILSACELFFKRASSTDDLLIYFSGHAVTEGANLYWCVADTVASRPISTAVDTGQISKMISSSGAGSITILLDCCFSGAFKGSTSNKMGGRGRYVISATTQMETAQDAVEEGTPSPFTKVLLASLTHDANPDEDGFVSLDAIYRAIMESKDLEKLSTVERDFDGSGSPQLAKRVSVEVRKQSLAAEQEKQLAVEKATSAIPIIKWRRRAHGDYVKSDLRTWIYSTLSGVALAGAVLWSYFHIDQIFYMNEVKEGRSLIRMVTFSAAVPALLCIIIGFLDYKWQKGKKSSASRRSQLRNMDSKFGRAGLLMRIPLLVVSLVILLLPVAGIGVVTAPWVVASGLLALMFLESVGALSRRGDQLAVASIALLSVVQLTPIYGPAADGSNWGFFNNFDSPFGWLVFILGLVGLAWWAFLGTPEGYWFVGIGTAVILLASLPQALGSFSPHLILIGVALVGLFLALSLGAGRLIPLDNDRNN